MRIGFVCTNYNNSAYTRAAIASLRAGRRWCDVRVAVVDNGSRAGDVASLHDIAREFPEVDLVCNAENVGYFPGLNIGIRRLRTRFPDIDLLIVGNNDLVFPESFLQSVQRYGDVFDTWAVVAPDLVTPAGVHQNPHVRHPIGRIRKVIWDLYFLSYGAAVLIRLAAALTRGLTVREENAADGELYKTAGPIEQGYGACYLLGPVFFRHFTQLLAPTFLMQEEFFLYEQLKEIDQLTYFDPRFVVFHHGHATMHNVPSRRQWQISQEAHRVYKRYLAMSPAERCNLIAAGSREPGCGHEATASDGALPA
ncbi:MAG TPA: glycosyltransferase [Nitrospirales bacterium]|nr:glycosyltransferase [Nitrospirales bacterium]